VYSSNLLHVSLVKSNSQRAIWFSFSILKSFTCKPFLLVLFLEKSMANNWKIPAWLEKEVREKDKGCVYCGVEFTPTKVSKKLSIWLESKYCQEHNINHDTIAPIIQDALHKSV
jgi:hypothetical protein